MVEFTWQFGERFRWVRKTTKLTQENFGKLMGVSRQTINAYEKDRQRPTLTMMEKVCGEMEISPRWLLAGVGDPKGESIFAAAVEGGPVLSVSEQNLSPEQLSLISFVAEDPVRAGNLARMLFDEGLKKLAPPDETDPLS